MSGFRIVLVTTSGLEEAERLANLLVGAGLAPCVNIIPSIISVYQWKNKLNRDEEALMIIKTSESSFDEIREIIEKNHSYDVPEIISLEISQLSATYAAYLGDFLKQPPHSGQLQNCLCIKIVSSMNVFSTFVNNQPFRYILTVQVQHCWYSVYLRLTYCLQAKYDICCLHSTYRGLCNNHIEADQHVFPIESDVEHLIWSISIQSR